MRNLSLSIIQWLILFTIIFLSVNSNASQETPSSLKPALDGYSPVSYFTKNIAEKGSAEFSSEYKGKTFYLASAKQVLLFNLAPKNYIPKFGGSCPYSLTLGRHVAIDPTRFKIFDGMLLLFHNSEELDALKQWNKNDDEKELFNKAEEQFVFYRFN